MQRSTTINKIKKDAIAPLKSLRGNLFNLIKAGRKKEAECRWNKRKRPQTLSFSKIWQKSDSGEFLGEQSDTSLRCQHLFALFHTFSLSLSSATPLLLAFAIAIATFFFFF
jgi:hypothetical protein